MSLTARLFDAQDNLVADGLLDNIINFQYIERLDEIGSFSMALPLAYARSKKYIDAATTIAVSDDYQEFFRGTINSASRAGTAYTVQGSDLLEELFYDEVGTSFTVNGDPLPDVIADLMAFTAKGWTANTSVQNLPVVASFQGRQVFDVLRTLIATYGVHLRRTSPTARVVDVSAFGNASGYLLTNPEQLSEGSGARNTAGILLPPNTTIDRGRIVNRVIATGGKYDSTVLTLPAANRVETGTIVNTRTRSGTIEYYIEDTASIAKYGVREKVVSFSDVTPASTSTSDVQRAEDSLKSRAVAYLARWGDAQTTHRLNTITFNRDAVRVGDKLTIRYSEQVSESVSIDLNGDFFLTETSTSFDSQGNVNYSLVVSDVNRVQVDDREALVAVFKQLEDLRLRDLK